MRKKALSPVMLAGTGSDVGKSVITAAFCRIFLQDGYAPAPFKAQNMALNSYATPDGLEIGRAQAVQAEAAGVPCSTDMNPLLLKPTTDKTCQVVLNGKVAGTQSAEQYFKVEGRDELRKEVHAAFDRLSMRYNPVVMEGAGSIAEVNLREVDLVNMSMAIYAKANVILVADIDKGGVIASVYGTVMLLTEEECRHVKGIIINKFRGDISLFQSGVKIIEELCGIPVLGVIPYFNDIFVEDEDSLPLHVKNLEAGKGKVNVAVVLLRHLANFTDFNALEQDPRVHLYYTANASEVEKADIVIIPGSKSTLSDLQELRRSGLAQSIANAYKSCATVMGICGGFQLMGHEVSDPLHVEGDIERLPGLGLLPVSTQMLGEKVTKQVKFRFLDTQEECEGYEIHMGSTTVVDGAEESPLNLLHDGRNDGYYLSQKCFGTYVHGILDNSAVVDFLLKPYTNKSVAKPFDFKKFKEEQYNKLADHVRKHIDMQKVYEILAL